jgi:putative tryptophan/tyrosine transport system substrate-binding protein
MRQGALAAIAAILILFASQAVGQQMHRIGFLGAAVLPGQEQAFVDVLRTRGYVVGENLEIDFRHSEDQNEPIPALVAELVARGPEVIVTSSRQNSVAVHAAAPTIPLVFMNVADPVGIGLVKSLAHPGGTATGFATNVPEAFVGKQLDLLKSVVPKASRLAILMNPENQIHARERATKFAEYAKQSGVELIVVDASKPDQYEAGFEAARNQGAEAIFVMGDPLTFIHSAKINEIAARYHLPAMHWFMKNVQDGGLMSYGPNQADNWPRAADYVARILKGEKPGDLPVQQPTEYDLFLNLKTAKALGITFPPSILAQAKEVIE